MGGVKHGLGAGGPLREGVWRSKLQPHVSQGLRHMSLTPRLLSPPLPHRGSEPNDGLKGTYSSCPPLSHLFFSSSSKQKASSSFCQGGRQPIPSSRILDWARHGHLSSAFQPYLCPTLVLLTPQGPSQSHLPPQQAFLPQRLPPTLTRQGSQG